MFHCHVDKCYSLIPRPSCHPVFDSLRSLSPFYHVKDFSVYLDRQVESFGVQKLDGEKAWERSYKGWRKTEYAPYFVVKATFDPYQNLISHQFMVLGNMYSWKDCADS